MNLLILRVSISLELFLNHDFYSRLPRLTDVYGSAKTVLEQKLFASYE